MRALISVSDKSGVVEFANSLASLGFELVSTGGTEKMLKEAGLTVKNISEVTGFPECLDGRVKTLHPAVHGGILARRDLPEHMQELNEQNIEPIDLVAINLYPFKETISKEDVELDEAIENIDIGGPTMLRAAAKNHKDVTVVCDPADYDDVIEELKKAGKAAGSEAKGDVPQSLRDMRYKLALKVFRHTAAYDALIASYLGEQIGDDYPDQLTLTFEKIQALRYGENSHQKGVYYREPIDFESALTGAKQLQGKELSFNNINDTNGAVNCLKEFPDDICVVAVKHANPCGVGIGDSVYEAYRKAHDCDPTSIFGGIVAVNEEVDAKTAKEMVKIFLEIIIAPSFTDEAIEVLSEKKNLRLLVQPDIKKALDPNSKDYKRVDGGLLVQDADVELLGQLETVTKKAPDERELADLIMAMKVVKHTRSNAIVFVKDGMTIGIGPGQTNRIWAVQNGLRQSHFDTRGAVMASDAFFPFDDCVSAAAEAGITAIIQPGGSKRDQDSIDKADEMGLSMIFSGLRHFKH